MEEPMDPDPLHTPLANLSPEVLAEYLTQLQANLDRVLDRSERQQDRIAKLEVDHETLRERLEAARTSTLRKASGRLARRRSTTETTDAVEPKQEPPLTAVSEASGPSVATILDPISSAVFGPELDAAPLSRHTWRQQLEQATPDFLFVESAFNGVDGEWAFRVAHFGTPHNDLAELVTGAKAMGIPTVLWNKEDPINYGMFIGAASLFDHVFTVDASTIERYQDDLGHRRVHLLPFAAQPILHFPPDSPTERKGDIAFAGSYYAHKHPERRVQMDYLLSASLEFGLDIYDRMNKPDDPRFAWPDRFARCIVGSVPYREMGDVYRGYKGFLNVNTVTDSPTMCARRVFELAACGTPIVTGPSSAIEKTLPDGIAYIAKDKQEAVNHIRRVLDDPAVRSEASTAGPEWIHRGNTYADRLTTIMEILG